MKKTFIIIVLVLLCFLLEFLIFNIGGRWFMPNLLLLLVIFFNLYLGIRYSIFTAVCAGFMKDSFCASVFGINLVSFVICAYMVTILKRYIYHAGSKASRMLLVFCIVLINLIVNYVLLIKFSKVNFFEAVKYLLLPELTTTLIVSTAVFHNLKKCVSRLSV
ncbi:MAG: rod shape-determining protein MreD [Omnitrophica WOR_2 bacterium GWF2_38_59]|nr:MAG: rod shape-determining protein MreD [Omnitrophica WOR_2 bacterium GWA2_37_7]OGX25279.1 MAG: rod shape-determining protein MreD [Omnitrophica WOR_2 bacterium GWF2_38_59]OGX47951.1 MAG: rod shape-determining protein MreD [Omnitrophica WOR_2 bacterium RIFOXYA2_FULL_38_17]OGX52402.1 MAG: rod shape-determining protein MreD [Omnitrophica WOR_2 bacterium RIFOXYA12_FULL_38_10]OGX56288.1 MAG: rod shape-determining protein MreD [Omnitrophica WOR_2 bacterium RIFOXYC2_FULL_38_12]OGX60207.1 MAG: rod